MVHRNAILGRAWGYIRVSTRKQVKSGLGMKAQRRAIDDYYRRVLKPRGIAWGGFFTDRGVSASRTPLAKRPDGAKLIAAASSGDHVVIAKMDRGFRSLHDLTGWLRVWNATGIGLHLIDFQVDTTLPVGKLMCHVMAA